MNLRLPRFLSLRFPSQTIAARLAISFALLSVITAATIILSLYSFARAQIRQEVRQRLVDTVAVAALSLDPNIHASLVDPQQEDSPEYNQVHQSLMNIYYAVDNLAYVYTMRLVNDENGNPQIIFIVDADIGGAEGSAALGEAYSEAPPELLQQMQQNAASPSPRPWADQDFTTDRWGTFLSAYTPLFTSDGRQDAFIGIDMLVSDVVAYERQLLWIAILIFAIATAVVSWLSWELGRRLSAPLQTLTQDVRQIAFTPEATFTLAAPPVGPHPSSGTPRSPSRVRLPSASAGNEVLQLAQAFNEMAARVNESIDQLEQRVEQRTQELAQRTAYLEAAAQLSRSISTILDQEELMIQVVERIRMRFNLYYVGLFLVDESNTWAVLKAGTGRAGQSMLERRHRIRLGSGMIGWSIINARPRITHAAGEDDIRLSTPELPQTRSEAALPLRSRGQVLGALSVQSEQANAFDEQILTVLQVMADQVAVAIDNARLLSESQAAIQSERRAYGEIGQQAWRQLLQSAARSGQPWGYRYTASAQQPDDSKSRTLPSITPVASSEWEPAMQQAAQNGAPYQAEDGSLALPIKVRQQVIGVLHLRRTPAPADGLPVRTPDQSASPWSTSEIEMLSTITAQISQAVESARLYQETQNRAGREKLIGEVTANMRASLDMEQVLKTTMREIAERLALAQVQIHLAAPPSTPQAAKSDKEAPG